MFFGITRFRRLLLVSCASYAVINLMDLTDTMIAGQLLGEVALGAIGLFWPVAEILCFLATALSGGTAIRYSEAVSIFDHERANRLFSGGLVASVLLGIGVATALLIFRDACFAFFGAGEETLTLLRPYWTWFAMNAALVPTSTFLSTLICTDGDGRTCTIAFSTEIVVNIIASYFLCRWYGTAGCALGTVAGTLTSLAILPCHFLRSGNSLRFRPTFSVRESFSALIIDFPESGYLLFTGLIYVFMNKILVMHFGDDVLPVVTAIITANGLMYFFYGVSKAVQPIVGVYLGEKNTIIVRAIMRDALRWATGLGLGLAVLVFAFPQATVRLVGIDSPNVVQSACQAVRIDSFSFVFNSISALLTSYWLFIRRVKISMALVFLHELIYPMAGCLIGLAMGGLTGFWIGYALAPFLALVSILAFLKIKRERIPFLLDTSREAKIFIWSIPALDLKEACRVSEEVKARLNHEGKDMRSQMRAALMVEETLVDLHERNLSATVKSELVLDLNEGVHLCFRDDAVTDSGFGLNLEEMKIRSQVLDSLHSAGLHRTLLTTGYNRRMIEI